MKNVFQNEKGLTIIEIVISLAVLSVIMLSVSGLISTVLNNKQFAESKQQASLLAQEIMEQIQLIDTLSRNQIGEDAGHFYIPLAGNEDLIKIDTNNILEGTYKANIKNMDITLELEKSGEQTTPTIDRFQVIEENVFNILIENKDNQFNVSYVSSEDDSVVKPPFTLTKEQVLEVKFDKDTSKITVSNKETHAKITSDEIDGLPEITLNFPKEFVSPDGIKVDLNNNDESKPFKVNISRYTDSQVNLIYEPTPNGWIKIINNRFEGLNPIGELYNFTLRIKQQNKLLFEGYGNKNFNIG